jgi:hypothetical protein
MGQVKPISCTIRNICAVTAMFALGACVGFSSEKGLELAKDCAFEGAKTSLLNIHAVDDAMFACLGQAESERAKLSLRQIAVMLLANLSVREIQLGEDPGARMDQAIAMIHHVNKARKRLNERNEDLNPKADPTAMEMPLYFEALQARTREGYGLVGVLRSALRPSAERAKKTIRRYISAASGGVTGIVSQLFSRREIIKKKIGAYQTTRLLAMRALFDARCLIRDIDMKMVKKSEIKPEEIFEGPESESRNFECKINRDEGFIDKAWEQHDKQIGKALEKLKSLSTGA